MEEYGVRVGAVMNWPPLAGRMMATLMLNDGPMTADQLREELGASAGGISECSRILMESGVVERIKTAGTRKRSYAYRPDAWVACLQHQIAMSVQLRDLATSACKTLRRKPKHIRRRFEDMRHYQDFMTRSLTNLEDSFKEAAGFQEP
ncbi:GbsR/MarR family transcriptional regulator [Phytohabitans kaempferiae]|uniref:GbsR/MarR family transcriptional regulator n=1 Tax=Phytohabitans kaempferiae TaxID=1620943 RepID=A0ABV6LYG5_9ACTN